MKKEALSLFESESETANDTEMIEIISVDIPTLCGLCTNSRKKSE